MSYSLVFGAMWNRNRNSTKTRLRVAWVGPAGQREFLDLSATRLTVTNRFFVVFVVFQRVPIFLYEMKKKTKLKLLMEGVRPNTRLGLKNQI